MSDKNDVEKISIYGQMICAAAAGSTADVFTHPIDTIKVWLQVSSNSKCFLIKFFLFCFIKYAQYYN